MICPICDSNKWKNIDYIRIKPEGMAICEECNFVTYPDKCKSKDELREYYKTNYRNAPTVGNLYTGERKLHLHNHFLRPLIDRWNSDGKKRKVFEVGSAYGLFLNWIRHELHGAEVHGSEWDLFQKRNAYHEFGLRLVDDFDTSQKWDMIVSYKVLEHMVEPDKELLSYRECLTDDGLIYISVPVWYERLFNHGDYGFEFERYFSPNHINVWNLAHVKSLFAKCGLEIVEHNDKFYDHTFLLKKGKFGTIEKQSGLEEQLQKIRQVNDLIIDGKYEEAVKVWPNTPMCYKLIFEMNRKKFNDMGYDKIEKSIIRDAIINCPNSFDVYTFAADLAMRYNRWDRGIFFLSSALKITPESPSAYMALSHCYRHLANEIKDSRLIVKARDICRHIALTSSQMRAEAITWVYQDNANLEVGRSHQVAQSSEQQSESGEYQGEVPPQAFPDISNVSSSQSL